MRHHHLGSGRRTLLAPDWEAYAAPVVEQFMLEAVVNLRKSGAASTHWDDALGRTVTVDYTPFAWEVAASVKPISGSPTSAVEEQLWVLGYRISIPKSTTPTQAQLDEGVDVDIIRCADPLLVGQSLHVNEVVRGTHRFQRDLIGSINS